MPNVSMAGLWPTNLGSERDWAFQAQPNSRLHGRAIPLSMGKVLGGGSSINVMIWSRGHKNDWDLFADEAGDPAWNYESVLQIYRRIEDWQALLMQFIEVVADLCSCNRRRTRTPLLPLCSKARVRSVFLPLIVRMAA